MELLLQPPLITASLPGIGGQIKQEPAHFQVEEIPLYQPQGSGEHVYLRLSREGMTTRTLQKQMAGLFGLKHSAVGYAGLKDKQARVSQTFSLHLHSGDPQEVARRVEAELPVKVESASRHQNKLKRGHLLGNRFSILVSAPQPEAEQTCQPIAQALAQEGLPNFFGEQRFGRERDNAQAGRQALLGKGPRQPWLRQLCLSAFQSELFNLWLGLRLEQGLFAVLLEGDVAKKTETGGLFVVQDPKEEQARLDQKEITYTGPIYGSKMLWAQGQAGQRERQGLEQEQITDQMLSRAKLKGSRRPARIFIPDLDISPEPEGLRFSFTLPKGSYATTVLREFMKNETQA
ncbi:MAG: tRNA pseudouridine(13) synthase TruD [Desulfarculaceae bacterium]|jgi:tRNA pseudouridine13 synthase